eukprot:TRINITY_DN1335_c0_g1_i1.p1 TRINITY_DN1335_c0_g1~~TRINITY_DN1335_c0_g1_i1.p1  ORF type:complete len:310 (-),score=39.38 TRINITY_DN1335_c0_g1_i1:81-1010(-)
MIGHGMLFVVMLVGGVVATELEPEDSCRDATVSPPVSLLQTRASLGHDSWKLKRFSLAVARTVVQQRPNDTNSAFGLPKPSEYLGYRESGGMECGLNHTADLYKPIPQVLAEHPGVDGYCYFEYHAPWMVYQGYSQRDITDFSVSAEIARLSMRSNELMCPNDPGMNKGPAREIKYLGDNGSTITLFDRHVDCVHIAGDVKYCHALGWLGNQVDTSLMIDPDAWRALNERECERLNETYKFSDEEITVGKHIDDQEWIFTKDGRARNLALHGYHKCLLGHGAEEMAYCAHLSCLLPGTSDQIGHGVACE